MDGQQKGKEKTGRMVQFATRIPRELKDEFDAYAASRNIWKSRITAAAVKLWLMAPAEVKEALLQLDPQVAAEKISRIFAAGEKALARRATGTSSTIRRSRKPNSSRGGSKIGTNG